MLMPDEELEAKLQAVRQSLAQESTQLQTMSVKETAAIEAWSNDLSDWTKEVESRLGEGLVAHFSLENFDVAG